ncbi:hypothetical protein [Amycolatopsis alkalitolerans]|uniref:Uncharacterized protein n=1 Tax=Amycolatopsis alkalitolerans TaxID=2547244 RepID=A0A5C4LRZ2_9PSEU|nr:hypothetical protein [Amycolatopsis alkalitolerans]TNC20994.1 hypothetical protein FG385_29540 [Amycolatopsis alkalitolerans]
MTAFDQYVTVLGRLRPGSAGQARRVGHLFVVPPRPGPWISALCGLTLRCADIEVLDRPSGMPCEQCLLRAGEHPSVE